MRPFGPSGVRGWKRSTGDASGLQSRDQGVAVDDLTTRCIDQKSVPAYERDAFFVEQMACCFAARAMHGNEIGSGDELFKAIDAASAKGFTHLQRRRMGRVVYDPHTET